MSLLNRSLWFPYLIWLGDSLLYDLNIFFTEEATSQQVVQDALEAPQPGHQQLPVVGEDVQASGFFSLIHIYCRTVTSVGSHMTRSC